MKTHQEIDQRSLALHRLALEKFRDNPQLFVQAKERLQRWMGSCSPDLLNDLSEWQRLMDLGESVCLAVALENSQYASALRQSSPLCFFMSHQERFRFLKTWRAEPSDASA
jgi:hypothetical protein